MERRNWLIKFLVVLTVCTGIPFQVLACSVIVPEWVIEAPVIDLHTKENLCLDKDCVFRLTYNPNGYWVMMSDDPRLVGVSVHIDPKKNQISSYENMYYLEQKWGTSEINTIFLQALDSLVDGGLGDLHPVLMLKLQEWYENKNKENVLRGNHPLIFTKEDNAQQSVPSQQVNLTDCYYRVTEMVGSWEIVQDKMQPYCAHYGCGGVKVSLIALASYSSSHPTEAVAVVFLLKITGIILGLLVITMLFVGYRRIRQKRKVK
ncbi:MAG: hypothetical protein JWM56_1057 [Candidatus Peribacteria bacterium]|nr:hypothetical protein [Candidatus Peribacteria bacterium]